MKIIGVDLSLTGAGVAGNGWSETVGAAGRDGDSWPVRAQRIEVQRVRVMDLISWTVDLVVIEGPSYNSKSTSTHDRAGLWWAVYTRLMDREVPVAVVPPPVRAKYATGKGNAGKSAVVEQVARRWGHIWTDLGGDDNRADAAVLCAMGYDQHGCELVPVPAVHRTALAAVDWPESWLQGVA